MINIIIPMNGASLYETSSDFIYPKILTEISNKTIFEYSQEIFTTLKEEKKIIYVVPKVKLDTLGLKTIIHIISNNEAKIVTSLAPTKGAVCSALMAIDEINLDEELIISSADHHINDDLQEILQDFRNDDTDAAVLCFESVHPKWSSIKLNDKNHVIQAAEKISLSRYAIAGFYYFRKGHDFVEAAKNTIRKDSSTEDNFYLSSCLNELILAGKKVSHRLLADSIYHNFYDAHAIKAFERRHSQKNTSSSIKKLTEGYVKAFAEKSLAQVMDYFAPSASLTDPSHSLIGKEQIKTMLLDLFTQVKDLSFIAKNILIDQKKSIIEFELTLDNKKFKGVDMIDWNNKGKITSLNAYLY